MSFFSDKHLLINWQHITNQSHVFFFVFGFLRYLGISTDFGKASFPLQIFFINSGPFSGKEFLLGNLAKYTYFFKKF